MNNYLKREKEILDSIPPSRDEQVKKWLDSIKDKDMDYEKKYNKALAIARDFYNSTEYAKSHAEIKATYEAIFPELSESSDERIRKDIIHHIEFEIEKSIIPQARAESWIAWLEKQKHAEWSEVDNVRLEEAIQMVESNGGWIRSDDAVKLVSDWLKSLKDRALPQPKQEWSRDNNPKFKEGDWIVSDEANKDYRICKIITIKEGEYTIESIYGYKGHNVFKVFDNIYKKWTIQDAKDGDVLQLGMCTVIFKKLLDLNAWCYCSYTEKDGFDAVTDNDHIYGTGNASPATKEQRDLLFAKMKEEGYEWDAEKKQLRKISIRRFKEGDTIEFNDFGHNRYTIKEVHYDYYVSDKGRMDAAYTDNNFELVEPNKELTHSDVTKESDQDESEGEKIRKWCISHFRECFRVTKDNAEYKEYLNNKVIPWLEKQGEQKPVTSNNSRMVEAIIETIREIEEEKGWNCVYLQDNTEVKYADIISWLNSLRPQTEQFSFSGDINEGMYDENGWMELHDGIKMDRQGHIAGGLKLK